MCLEDFLESATRLSISELPHFWTWGEFALNLGRHINHHESYLPGLGVTILVGRGPTTFVTICGIIVDMTLLTGFRSEYTSG